MATATLTRQTKARTKAATSPRWYSLAVSDRTAGLSIYGDVTAYPWMESDVSAYNLSKQLEGLDVDQINVGINSYGGDISEGLAIYNALKRNSAKVTTRCDGFACSIASVIFMAGDERIMSDPSLLMIHNGWTVADGDAAALRKAADDIEKMTNASVSIYAAATGISEDDLRAMMDAETWLDPSEAVELGFATSVEGTEASAPSQSARVKVMRMLADALQADADGDGVDYEEPDDGEPETEEPETDATDDETDAPETTDDEEPGGDSPDDPEPDPESDPDEDPDDEDPDRPTTPAAQMMRLLHAIQHM